MAANVNDVVDYIVLKMDEGQVALTHLKLQKLLFYVQAWSLALRNERAFNARFQAWVHGPVSRTVFDRFKDTHTLYDRVGLNCLRPEFQAEAIPAELREHIDEVLETYAPYSGSQLEAMTHQEDPWIRARNGLPAAQRCETEIDEGLMADFYAKLLADADAKAAAEQATAH